MAIKADIDGHISYAVDTKRTFGLSKADSSSINLENFIFSYYSKGTPLRFVHDYLLDQYYRLVLLKSIRRHNIVIFSEAYTRV